MSERRGVRAIGPGACAALAGSMIAATLAAFAPRARADGSGAIAGAATAPKLAAVAIDPGDVRRAVLIGPGGQVYAPAAAGGWARTDAGGVAAGVTAATRVGGDVIAAGAAAPLYTWGDRAWRATPLPLKGAIVLGVGPAAAAAIGTAVIVRGDKPDKPDRPDKGWTKLPAAPAAPTALWAASDKDAWIVAGGAAWHLRGKTWTRGAAATGLAAGRAPWALGRGQVMDLSSGRAIAITAAGDPIAVAAAGGDTWILIRTATGGGGGGGAGAATSAILERHRGKTSETLTPPGGAAWTWLWADAHGRIAVAAPDGAVAVREPGADATWATQALTEALTPGRAGAGPATSD